MPRTTPRNSTEQPVASARRRPRRRPASASGSTGSNSIDDLVPRPALDWRDANTDWNDDASDGTLEERIYYCQNWRHDVVALVASGGALRERVRYTAYGIPVGMPHSYGWRDCDGDGDGDVDAADQSVLLGAWGTNTAKCDLNLDGTVDATDNAILLGQLGATAGFGRLSLSGNRFGYAGYASDPAVHADWHVRHRVLASQLGLWTSRNLAESELPEQLYILVAANPTSGVDAWGEYATGISAADPLLLTPMRLERQERNAQTKCGPFSCSATWTGHRLRTGCRPVVIQKIELEFRCGYCADPDDPCDFSGSPPFSITIYEWWPKVRKSTSSRPGPTGDGPATQVDSEPQKDTWVFGPLPPGRECGYFVVKAEARLYCGLNSTYGRDNFDLSPYGPVGAGCSGMGTLRPGNGQIRGRPSAPGIWNTQTHVASAHRSMTVRVGCCCGNANDSSNEKGGSKVECSSP